MFSIFCLYFCLLQLFFADFYCATTRTGTLGRKLGNHNLQFLKIKDSSNFLANRPITFMNLRAVF